MEYKKVFRKIRKSTNQKSKLNLQKTEITEIFLTIHLILSSIERKVYLEQRGSHWPRKLAKRTVRVEK
jgi:hypothetical protein